MNRSRHPLTELEINDRLREAARTLGYANIAIANNDVGEALSNLAEVCFNVATVCEALSSTALPITMETQQ